MIPSDIRHYGLEASIKWFDPKRSFGFCTCSLPLVSEASGPTDVFFGSEEAQAARREGLALSRGELVYIDVINVISGSSSGGGSGSCKRKRERLEVRGLRPRVSFEVATVDHGASILALSEKVRQVAPALRKTETFVAAASQLSELMGRAWTEHSQVGRARLESFFHGPCWRPLKLSV